MINYYDGQIADLLPGNITDDPAVQAVSLALRDGTRMLHDYTQLVYIYCNIDSAPDKVLDLLARELRTQYYTDGLEIEVKRSLIRNTLIWYMTAGTPAAVEELVAAVFGEGEVVEWFEYGGDPYWFKIKTNALLTEDMTTYFSEMIRRVKNTRSHIEAIEIHREIQQPYYAGAGAISLYKPAAIIDGYKVGREAAQTLNAGAESESIYKPAAIIDGYQVSRDASQETAAGVGAETAYKPAAIIDGFTDTGAGTTQETYAGVSQTAAIKPEAIMEDLKLDGQTVTQTIYAAQALYSKYNNTVKEE